MTQRVFIESYFSLPTDLAQEMRAWSEFIGGEGYSVDLKNAVTDEQVSIRYVEEWDRSYVVISSSRASHLFDRAIGRVIRALSVNSDNLMVRVVR